MSTSAPRGRAGVEVAACAGTVVVLVKKGNRTVAKHRTRVKSTCNFQTRVKLRKNAGRRGKVKILVRFLSNSQLLGASARTSSARYGR